MGEFELLSPVHVLRNVFEAPCHPLMTWCPVRHPTPSPGQGIVRLSLTINLCAAPVLTSMQSALPVRALAQGLEMAINTHVVATLISQLDKLF
jgi:hypothetical protein